jgi:hypothetical protein
MIKKVTFGKGTQKSILTPKIDMLSLIYNETTKRHIRKDILTAKIKVKDKILRRKRHPHCQNSKSGTKKHPAKGTSDTCSVFSAIQRCLNKFPFVSVKARKSTFKILLELSLILIQIVHILIRNTNFS